MRSSLIACLAAGVLVALGGLLLTWYGAARYAEGYAAGKVEITESFMIHKGELDEIQDARTDLHDAIKRMRAGTF